MGCFLFFFDIFLFFFLLRRIWLLFCFGPFVPIRWTLSGIESFNHLQFNHWRPPFPSILTFSESINRIYFFNYVHLSSERQKSYTNSMMKFAAFFYVLVN